MTGRVNDPENVEESLVAFAPRVYGLLRRLVGRPDVAEDLMQETLLRAVRSLATYRPEGKFRAWIFCIAVNLARDWMRRQRHEPAALLGDDGEVSPDAVPAPDESPDGPVLRRERRRCVEDALARLSEPDRTVLLMRYYGNLAFKDIARATDEPLGTVLSRAHRALRKLGDLIPEEPS